MRLLLGLFLFVSSALADEVYRKDVAFFLDEFEKQAGHFFEQKGIDWGDVRKWADEELVKVKSDEDHLRLCARLVALSVTGMCADLLGCQGSVTLPSDTR
jgi:hypothetical protein